MPDSTVTVFMGGDIFSSPGIQTVIEKIPVLKAEYAPDFIIWNGENASGGNGLIQADAEQLFNAGIDVITGGNHIFEKRDSYPFFESDARVLRPQNYPAGVKELMSGLKEQAQTAGETKAGTVDAADDAEAITGSNTAGTTAAADASATVNISAATDVSAAPETEGSASYSESDTPGRGFAIYKKNGCSIAVLNIQGREFMTALDCPFRAAYKAAEEAQKNGALLFIDFHAESNEEKEALGIFLDGRAAAVCGTHTHVQTADERILPKGTAYITDLGMTGVVESSIGANPDIAVRRNLTQVLYKMENAEGIHTLQGALITVDTKTKKAVSIRRISF